MSREEIARIIDEHAFDTVKMHGRHNASEQAVRSLDYALMRADKILALSAQGEPVAWLYETWCGENAWSQRYTDAEPSKNSWTRNIRPLYLAALPSSPAPYPGSLNSGESDLHVTADSGAGEAIFSECAEIALEHVGAVKDEDDYSYGAGYDAACSDIANTIKTRASNRKTMDAIADRKGE
jgi:hypothetical protein